MKRFSLRKLVNDSAAGVASEVNAEYDESRREAFVAVMQTADLRKSDNAAALRRLDGARVRAIVVE